MEGQHQKNKSSHQQTTQQQLSELDSLEQQPVLNNVGSQSQDYSLLTERRYLEAAEGEQPCYELDNDVMETERNG